MGRGQPNTQRYGNSNKLLARKKIKWVNVDQILGNEEIEQVLAGDESSDKL